MKKKPILVPISPRAFLQRLNRALAKRGELLKANIRPGPTRVGNYFTVDLERKSVIRPDVDLAELAKELGVLEPYERVEKEK